MLNYEEWEKQLPDHVKSLSHSIKKLLFATEQINEKDGEELFAKHLVAAINIADALSNGIKEIETTENHEGQIVCKIIPNARPSKIEITCDLMATPTPQPAPDTSGDTVA